MDPILAAVTYYSLFNKRIYDVTQYLPSNVFGVFVTIRRNQKLNSWPHDIHGCIGYWENNIVNTDILNKKLFEVAYDAMWNDSRKNYFDPIEKDSETFLEIDFMLTPVYQIDKTSNKRFNNKDYGIIIQKDSQRATYLPGVFQNISIREIINSVKEKAGIISDSFTICAYKVKQIKTKLSDLLFNKTFIAAVIFKFSRYLMNNYKENLNFPFPYSYKNGKLEWKFESDVRNVAILGDVIKYHNKYNTLNKKEYNSVMTKIINILNNIKDYDSQSLSFLGHIYSILNNLDNKKEFCVKLKNDLNKSSDDEFERPEIIIGLKNAKCKFDQPLINLNSYDSIFKMNWVIQAQSNATGNSFGLLKNKIKNSIDKKSETNYVAVAFEASCSADPKNNMGSIFELYFILENRRKGELYTFLDGSARVDITIHIMNGLFKLDN